MPSVGRSQFVHKQKSIMTEVGTIATNLSTLQTNVYSMFAQLRATGMQPLPADTLRPALIPSEQCFVQRLTPRGSIGILGVDHHAICKNASLPLPGCWNQIFPECEGVLRRGLGLQRLAATYLGRYQGTAAGDLSASHLAAVARSSHLKMLFIGDSTMVHVAQSAQCELQRTNVSAEQLAEQLAGLRNATQIERFELRGGEFASDDIMDATLKKLRTQLSRIANTGGGAVVAMFPGVHFNPTPGQSIDTVLHTYQTRVNKFVDVLGDFTTSQVCSMCVAILVTVFSQHFETPDGVYSASKMKVAAASSRDDSCVPWSATAAAASGTDPSPSMWASSREVKRPDDWMLPASSANSWRSDEVMRSAASRQPNVLLVPMHWLTSAWDGRHPGIRSRRGERTIDCTHFCFTPFLYEPVWWTLRAAISAATGNAIP